MRRATAAVLSAALAALAAACHSFAAAYEEERQADLDCAVAQPATPPGTAEPWIAVHGGAVVATGPEPDETARAAAAQGPSARHRFVFRPSDRGERLWRLTFLPSGGVVGGRRLLADLGFRVVSASADSPRSITVERRGSRRTLDLSERPSLRLVLHPLSGGDAAAEVDVPLDPDFDGPLLLPEDMTRRLDLDRAEIPGTAEVQVVLGRPFNARRAWAAARCPDLDATGAVEVLTRTTGR